jgi:alpha-L-rhamnosidase
VGQDLFLLCYNSAHPTFKIGSKEQHMLIVDKLTCEYRANPLGIDVTAPRLGWKLQGDQPGLRQAAYRILAASAPDRLADGGADLWDSGRIESDASIHVVYGGPKPPSRQRIYWQVTVWDATGAAATSEAAWFEMGLLKRSDWKAKWIGATLRGGPRSTVPAPYLRKPFTVTGKIAAARLYVTALGMHECTINGRRVSDDVFAPGWTDYQKRVQYNVYDVTELLEAGDNVLGAVLGDGWAAGHVGWNNRQQYFDRPRLLAQLEIQTTDGDRITVASDRTWKHWYGPLLHNDLLMGEAYDARLEQAGWDRAPYDDRRWLGVELFDDPGAALVATNGPTVRRIEELAPVADPTVISGFTARRYIFDLGQNMVGRARFVGSAPSGTTVTLRFAEVLDDEGNLYTDNLRTARASDVYTFKGEGVEVYEPKFTFHGFRYVELNGYPGEVDRATVTGIVLHSDMAPSGTFTCSDPLVNQLQHNIRWGQKGNFVDVPTDCPQRDERLGWTGDIQVFVRTAAFNFDVAGFMTKWAFDVADSQSEQGEIPPVVPYVLPLMRDGGPAWSDAAIICPWTIYLTYGDRRILEQNYGVMTRFMDFLLATSPGYIRCAPDYAGWLGFGDWLSINADTPRDLIGTAFLAYDANLMAQIATVLGKTREAAHYRKLFAEVKKAFGARFLVGAQRSEEEMQAAIDRQQVAEADAISRGNLKTVEYGPVASKVYDTRYFQPSQTAYVLGLHFDLLPAKLRAPAAAELVADIERRGEHLSTGFVGAPYLPHVLSANGKLDTAYKLLAQKTWPSWLYPVTQGATTIWERWDGWTEENGFQDKGMNSFNHYAYGSIGAWLYSTVAGIEIDPEQPGYKHSILRPQPGGDLTCAAARLQTLYGELVSDWRLENGRFAWEVVIPPNTTATAVLPNGDKHELTAGTHQFEVAMM